MIMHSKLLRVLLVTFSCVVTGVLAGCMEPKVTLNIIVSDSSGQCWSSWYTLPQAQAESEVTARAYIVEKGIEPFEEQAIPC